MKAKVTFQRRVALLAGSSGLFWAIVGLFVVEAAWIALSGRYPMAFDEDFHLGVIRLYAHHISPFWAHQPPGADSFGAVARDPSYLYQYLLSFPYRLISVITSSQSAQVIILRLLNVGLFAWGLVLIRRLLATTGAGRAVVNLCLLAFVLIPVVSQEAAQINYDNLLFPLAALSLLLAMEVGRQLAERQISLAKLASLLIICLLTSLVMYAFLPIFAAIAVCLFIIALRSYRTSPKGGFKGTFRLAWQQTGLKMKWLLAAGLILAVMLFGQRFGVNLVRYHTPIPGCGKVLSVQQCSAYGPWIRDYNYAINKIDEEHNPLVFTADWFYGMWLRLFFAVDGPGTQFETRGPLLLPAYASVLAAAGGVILTIVYGRRIWRRYNQTALTLFGLAIIFYAAALWLDEYRAYIKTGQPVAINGRYLFPILLPFVLILVLAFGEWLRRRNSLKYLLAGVFLLAMAWGGGGLTYILRSNYDWYWNNQAVRDVNNALQVSVGLVTPGFYQSTEFMLSGH